MLADQIGEATVPADRRVHQDDPSIVALRIEKRKAAIAAGGAAWPWLSLVTMIWIRSDCGPAGRVPSQIPSTGGTLVTALSCAVAGIEPTPRVATATRKADNPLLATQHPYNVEILPIIGQSMRPVAVN